MLSTATSDQIQTNRIQTQRVQTHILGFPQLGAQRELADALTRHWRGDLAADALEAVGRHLRARHWAHQSAAGLDWVTVGDFAYLDPVANHLALFGCQSAESDAGHAGTPPAGCFSMPPVAPHALAQASWFDTRSRYLVPQFSAQTRFSLHAERLLAEVDEAQALGHPVKAALLGPLTLLWLGSETADPAQPPSPFQRLDLLNRLLPVYGALLVQLKQLGVTWVQVDEPILGLDLPAEWRNAFERTYWQLNQAGVKLMLATYFSPLEENLSMACRLPVAGLHVDGVRAARELTSVCDWLPTHKVLSVGIVDGRNVWRTDLDAALEVLRPLLARRGELWLASSCSLRHVPLSVAQEHMLDPALTAQLAFACEKLDELHRLKSRLTGQLPASAALPPLPLLTPPPPLPLLQPLPLLPPLPAVAGRMSPVLPPAGDGQYDALDHFARQLNGCAVTAAGWVQSLGASCSKPPLIHGDVARRAGSRNGDAPGGMQIGALTVLQSSFVRADLPPARIAGQIATALRGAIIQDDETSLRNGLPLRSSQHGAYLAWATPVVLAKAA